MECYSNIRKIKDLSDLEDVNKHLEDPHWILLEIYINESLTSDYEMVTPHYIIGYSSSPLDELIDQCSLNTSDKIFEN